jgi:hypothetical protein
MSISKTLQGCKQKIMDYHFNRNALCIFRDGKNISCDVIITYYVMFQKHILKTHQVLKKSTFFQRITLLILKLKRKPSLTQNTSTQYNTRAEVILFSKASTQALGSIHPLN